MSPEDEPEDEGELEVFAGYIEGAVGMAVASCEMAVKAVLEAPTELGGYREAKRAIACADGVAYGLTLIPGAVPSDIEIVLRARQRVIVAWRSDGRGPLPGVWPTDEIRAQTVPLLPGEDRDDSDFERREALATPIERIREGRPHSQRCPLSNLTDLATPGQSNPRIAIQPMGRPLEGPPGGRNRRGRPRRTELPEGPEFTKSAQQQV